MSERKRYNWDLIEQLLHDVQNGERPDYVEQQAQAAEYHALLLRNGYIETLEGGSGGNFQLTPLGARLLAVIDAGAIPGDEHPREVLDDQYDALDPATFDKVASKAQIA